MPTESGKWLEGIGSFGNQSIGDVGLLPLMTLMLVSLFCALFISWLYVRFYRVRATGSLIHRSFPLLGPSITAIFITIQFSLPLSLGLLGALSIVRFRTPIKEPEEAGFIMLVVATSLCCATFNIFFLFIILAVAVAALFLMHAGRLWMERGISVGMAVVTFPKDEFSSVSGRIVRLLEEKAPRGRIDSIVEHESEAVLSYSFSQLPGNALLELQNELGGISEKVRVNLFFNRLGEF